MFLIKLKFQVEILLFMNKIKFTLTLNLLKDKYFNADW